MIDSTTQQRMSVSKESTEGPYIMVPLDQLEAVKSVLREHDVYFWVDTFAISLEGRPEVTVVNLGRNANAEQIQQMLDAGR